MSKTYLQSYKDIKSYLEKEQISYTKIKKLLPILDVPISIVFTLQVKGVTKEKHKRKIKKYCYNNNIRVCF